MAFLDQICLGDGQCMVPGHKDNEFTYSNNWKCTNNCKPVKCSYNIICGNQQPQWIHNENNKLCIYCNINGLECRTTPSEVIIHKNKECPVCKRSALMPIYTFFMLLSCKLSDRS